MPALVHRPRRLPPSDDVVEDIKAADEALLAEMVRGSDTLAFLPRGFALFAKYKCYRHVRLAMKPSGDETLLAQPSDAFAQSTISMIRSALNDPSAPFALINFANTNDESKIKRDVEAVGG